MNPLQPNTAQYSLLQPTTTKRIGYHRSLVLIIKTFESLKFYERPHDNDNLTKDALQVIQLIEIFLMSTSLEMMSQQPFQIF